MRVSANHILELLAAKHSKDVFIPECKDGPTQSVSNHMRMDAWVMNRSWAHPRYTVYEIKVSRADFLNDTKWRGYLPYCNELFFVAPKGLIDISELPSEAGLLELLGGVEGKRLVTRKKAAWREVEVPEFLFRYVLMCRVVVAREWQHEKTEDERREAWRSFVRSKVEDRKLGYEVGDALREKVQFVEKENKRLVERMGEYDDVRRILSRMDINPDHHVSEWLVERRLQEMRKVFDQSLIYKMEALQHSIESALTEARRIQDQNESETKVA